MPHPKQVVPREWPYPVKRKALERFCERYPLTRISAELDIPVTTLYRWSWQECWREVRSQMTLDLGSFVTAQRSYVEKLLIQTLRICEKLNTRVESALSEGRDVDAASLERIAATFQRNSDVLLRLLGR
jgi:hypothetical protein